MPELPEVERVRRQLDPVLSGVRIRRVLLRRANLRRPFPPDFATQLEGQRVLSVERRGKYLVVALDSGGSLLMHLGMSGSFRVEPRKKTGERIRPAATTPSDRHDHVVFELSSGAVVIFNDPRRFGMMDLVPAAGGQEPHPLEALGPEPLAESFDAARLARACAGRRTSLKAALLDQRIVAGLGNIYASEALHLAALSPLRRSSSIAGTGGLPRPAALRLASAIKSVLNAAIARHERPYRRGRFRVYDREGDRCPRRGCDGTIRRIVQQGRSTFYCPTCQR